MFRFVSGGMYLIDHVPKTASPLGNNPGSSRKRQIRTSRSCMHANISKRLDRTPPLDLSLMASGGRVVHPRLSHVVIPEGAMAAAAHLPAVGVVCGGLRPAPREARVFCEIGVKSRRTITCTSGAHVQMLSEPTDRKTIAMPVPRTYTLTLGYAIIVGFARCATFRRPLARVAEKR